MMIDSMNCKKFDHNVIKSFINFDTQSINTNSSLNNYPKEKIKPPLDQDLAKDSGLNSFEKNDSCYIIYRCQRPKFNLEAILFEGVADDLGQGVFVQLNSYTKEGEFIDALLLMKLFTWEIEYRSEFSIETDCIVNICHFARYPSEDSPIYDGTYPPGQIVGNLMKYEPDESGIFYLKSIEIID